MNKISGFYGMLSLFTGHPLDFAQCLYYLTSILITPFYISMLRNLSITLPTSAIRFKNSTINKLSFVTILFQVDTVLSLLFTLYFSWFWFSGTAEAQDSSPNPDFTDSALLLKRAVDRSAESATPSREFFVTVSSTLVVCVARAYFSLVFLSFTRNMIKAAKYNSVHNNDDQEMDTEFLNKNVFQRKLRQLEIQSGNYLRGVFN